MATNNSCNVATGASGTFLQAKGVGTTSSFSSSSYPSTNNTSDIIYGSSSNVRSNLPVATMPGQFLNYNGTNVNWFNPLQESYIYDDFVTGSTTSNLGWRTLTSGTGAAVALAASTNNAPGTISLNCGSTQNGYAMVKLGPTTSNQSVILGGGLIAVNFVLFSAGGVNSNYNWVAGLVADNTPVASPANGVYFTFTDGFLSTVVGFTANSSVRSSINTNVSPGAGALFFSFVINAAASSVTFYFNGVSKGTITTHIPTTSLSPVFWITAKVNVNPATVFLDYFSMYQSLTSAR